MNILIENVKILTMADGEVIKNGNIYIENEKIKREREKLPLEVSRQNRKF